MTSFPRPSYEPAYAPPASGVVAEARRLTWRRRLVGVLVGGTVAVLFSALLGLFAAGGLRWTEAGMLLCFLLTLPWQVLGFWNALIGFVLLRVGGRDAYDRVVPLAGLQDPPSRPRGRVALLWPIFHEDVGQVFRHLDATLVSLDATGFGDAFELHVLSDSQRPAVVEAEEAAIEARLPRCGGRLHYRRRADNVGYKAGNLREWVDQADPSIDVAVVLDADSAMTGASLLRLVRVLERNPRVGILQSLAVGTPSVSPFARIFQFGMRQGMRSYTVGSVWWQGDSGPFWGHNAALRLAPFRDHCHLPVLPGEGPLGGHVMSHDQVEAVQMRAAGYEVRVIFGTEPDREESFEVNPPHLLEFIRRDLRWCQGNLQYLRLFRRLEGLRPLGRLQLTLAILMYVGSPFWMGFVLLGFLQAGLDASGLGGAGLGGAGLGGAGLGGAAVGLPGFAELPASYGVALVTVMMTVVFAPKLFGVLDLLLRPESRRAYGGVARILASALLETLFSLLLGPVVAVSVTTFMVGLLFGRRMSWNGQVRDPAAGVSWGEAARQLWWPTLLGVIGTALLAVSAPSLLGWASPVLAGWLFAIPFTVWTSRAGFGRTLQALGLCPVPEERRPPDVLRELGLEALQPRERRATGAGDASVATP